jgi:hypothetical protein
VPIDPEPRDLTVKIRYSHGGTAATVPLLGGNRAQVRLHEPQRAVTPGQAAVLYQGDVVVGGGWICRTQPRTQTEPVKQNEETSNSATVAGQIELSVA